MNQKFYDEFPGIDRFMATAPEPVQATFQLMEHLLTNFTEAREAGVITPEEDESMRQAVTGFRLLLILAFRGMSSIHENTEQTMEELMAKIRVNPTSSQRH
jgi:hypothetical protein